MGMPQLFQPATNLLTAFILLSLILFLVLGATVAGFIYRSSYATGQYIPRAQPVPFSHQHHVEGLGIDCRFCHSSVEDSSFAGFPATEVCMTCHSQIWTNSPLLEPVRSSFDTGTPIPWVRIHDLPDFVYFDHSVHVQKGIGCSTCHGRVDRMPITWKAESLHMRWCLDCHKQPARFLRPKHHIFNMDFSPQKGEAHLAEELATHYGISSPSHIQDCSVCHR